MCGASSKTHMSRVCGQARKSHREDLIAFAESQRKQYVRYAGHVLAMGRLAAAPFPDENAGPRALWWAPIRDFVFFENPIPPEEWKPFIKISRTGSITELNQEQATTLESIAFSRNPNTSAPIHSVLPENSIHPCETILPFAGLLALDPGTLTPLDVDEYGEQRYHYEMSGLMRDFESEFFGSGLLDPRYPDTLHESSVYSAEAGIDAIDVAKQDASLVLAILSACVCQNYHDEGFLYDVASNGFLDRCLRRLAEIDASPGERPSV